MQEAIEANAEAVTAEEPTPNIGVDGEDLTPTEFTPPYEVTVWQEEAQAIFDQEFLDKAISEVRKLMAAAKVNKVLAQKGLLQEGHDLHPRKFTAAIAQHREAITVLTELKEQVGQEGLPEVAAHLESFNEMPAKFPTAPVPAPEGA